MATDKTREQIEARLKEARIELEDRKRSIPAHSIRPHQIMELEQLEEEVKDLEAQLEKS